jgi:hypothetical protein
VVELGHVGELGCDVLLAVRAVGYGVEVVEQLADGGAVAVRPRGLVGDLAVQQALRRLELLQLNGQAAGQNAADNRALGLPPDDLLVQAPAVPRVLHRAVWCVDPGDARRAPRPRQRGVIGEVFLVHRRDELAEAAALRMCGLLLLPHVRPEHVRAVEQEVVAACRARVLVGLDVLTRNKMVLIHLVKDLVRQRIGVVVRHRARSAFPTALAQTQLYNIHIRKHHFR